MPLIIIAAGVALLLILMIGFKVNGFIALVLVAGSGLASPQDCVNAMKSHLNMINELSIFDLNKKRLDLQQIKGHHDALNLIDTACLQYFAGRGAEQPLMKPQLQKKHRPLLSARRTSASMF